MQIVVCFLWRGCVEKAIGRKDVILHTSGGRRLVPAEKKVAVPANNGVSEVEVVKFLT